MIRFTSYETISLKGKVRFIWYLLRRMSLIFSAFFVFSVDEEFFDKFGLEFSVGDTSDTGLVKSASVAFSDESVFSVDFVASLPEPFGAEFAGGG